mgnify:CR=1 FL=1
MNSTSNINRSLAQSAIDAICILVLASIGLYAYYRVDANMTEARDIDKQVRTLQEQIIKNEERMAHSQTIAIGVIENRLTGHDNLLSDMNRRVTIIEVRELLRPATQPSK